MTSLERKAGGLMLYARLIADQLEATSDKIDFLRASALPAGLDEIYAENFRRVFVDDAAWRDALPLVELMCAAAEPLTVDAASNALGWDRARCKEICDGVSLLFPLREGDVIGVLHKTVTDWLMGEAPFDKRCSEDAFFVAQDAARTGGWRGHVLGRFVLEFWIRSRTRATPPPMLHWLRSSRATVAWRRMLCDALVLVSHEAVK